MDPVGNISDISIKLDHWFSNFFQTCQFLWVQSQYLQVSVASRQKNDPQIQIHENNEIFLPVLLASQLPFPYKCNI